MARGAVIILPLERCIKVRIWGWNFGISTFSVMTLLLILWGSFILYQGAQPFEKQDLRPFMGNMISEEKLSEVLPQVEFYYGDSMITHKKPYNFVHFFLRKMGHFFVYAILAFFLVQQQLLYKKDAVRAFTLALFTVLAVAIIDEGMQHFSAQRSGMFLDVLLDISGTIPVLVWLSYREFIYLNPKRTLFFPVKN